MSAGLVASTLTPGITAPVPSLTMPAIPPVCANDAAGRSATRDTTMTTRVAILIGRPSSAERRGERVETAYPSGWPGIVKPKLARSATFVECGSVSDRRAAASAEVRREDLAIRVGEREE